MKKTPLSGTPPVSPDELSFAMAAGSAAAAGLTPLSGVAGYGIDLDEGDGRHRRLEFADTPQNRAMFAIKEQFPENFTSLMMRVWALGAMMADERMKSFSKPSEDRPEFIDVEECVFDIAAIMPLNSNGQFNPSTFFKRVSARAEEKKNDRS